MFSVPGSVAEPNFVHRGEGSEVVDVPFLSLLVIIPAVAIGSSLDAPATVGTSQVNVPAGVEVKGAQLPDRDRSLLLQRHDESVNARLAFYLPQAFRGHGLNLHF